MALKYASVVVVALLSQAHVGDARSLDADLGSGDSGSGSGSDSDASADAAARWSSSATDQLLKCMDTQCPKNFQRCQAHGENFAPKDGSCSVYLACYEQCQAQPSKPTELQCEQNCEQQLNSNAALLHQDLLVCVASQCGAQAAVKQCQGWADRAECENIEGCFFTAAAGCSSSDTSAPTFQNCPLDFTDLPASKGQSFKALTWVPIGALDNGNPATVTQVSKLGSGGEFPVGTTSVHYEARDEAQPPNVEHCRFSVTILDTEKPTMTFCPQPWRVVSRARPEDVVLGQDGRYYAAAEWTRPDAEDNVGLSWKYSASAAVRDASRASTKYAAGEDFTLNGGSAAIGFAPGSPAKNVGMFPVCDEMTSPVTYVAEDAAGNNQTCHLDVQVAPSHLSYFEQTSRNVPTPPADSAGDWVSAVVVAKFSSMVPRAVCAEKCRLGDHGKKSCDAFLASTDGVGQCVLLNLNSGGAAFNADQLEFSANWDFFQLQAKSSQMCTTYTDARACLDVLTSDVYSSGKTSCLNKVKQAHACVSQKTTDAPTCKNAWVVKVFDSLRAASDRRCKDEPEEDKAYTPASTTCSAKYHSLTECKHACCDSNFRKTKTTCTVVTSAGVAPPSDEKTSTCVKAAGRVYQTCTERCLRARPFGVGDGAAIADVASDQTNIFGQSAANVKIGDEPPAYHADIEFRVEINKTLPFATGWNNVSSSTARAGIITSLYETYGLNMDEQHVGLAQNTPTGNQPALTLSVSLRTKHTDTDPVSKLITDARRRHRRGSDASADLAQTLFAEHQEELAQQSATTLDMPPRLAGSHDEMLLERLRANDPVGFLGLTYTDLTKLQLTIEYSKEYIANYTTPSPRQSYTRMAQNVTLAPEAAILSDLDDTDASAAKSNNEGTDSAASSGVVAFAVIVPLFVLIVVLALYLKYKSHHAKVQPLNRLSFKQSEPMQSLPKRSIPGFHDRNMAQVRSNDITQMPTVRSMPQVDPFASAPGEGIVEGKTDRAPGTNE